MNDVNSAAAQNPVGTTGTTGATGAAAAVDERNPWLGLASFTEETRDYFFGREEEVAELARRVQRKLLTVLFGQSGLGKTSILRAGLVPRLRSQGYCPIYVRIDYGKDSPEPAEQIKEAISRAARHFGEWTQSGVAVAGESLWEYLHHRDDMLRDEAGKTLTPLLIFDQFEEIFTLAQSDDFGRARAAKFIEELGDLVENRPPKSLEAKLEADDAAAERFDFARSDYRVLIALREDYLAPLEGLKKTMPSISQNRLRLAPMTGAQALAAVLQPGGKLVTEEVAAAIVRFVAGGAELANAEVEPSLLSLICRELNDARIAQGREEMSLDLLAGSHATILSNFYERALADQPPAVRQIVEDDLLTSSGFRENIAEERLISRFKAEGAAPDTLATLVNRRLLRVEERLDVRRVELTHDVLCGVVKASRDLRREREAREATERMLENQRARELAARTSLVRARQIAAVCISFALLAAIAAVFAVLSSRRAHRSEQLAEQTRSGAEHLLGYLTDEVVRELEAFGQLKVIAEFSKRQIDYFHSLPPELRTPESVRNGAVAMVHYARVMRALGDLDTGSNNANEAIALLEDLRSRGDRSDASAIGLATAYAIKGAILDNRNDAAGEVASRHSLEILAPVAESSQASPAARRAYLEVLVRRGYELLSNNSNDDAVRTEQQAMDLATRLGAREEANYDMAALYAEAAGWQITALLNLGRNAEARRTGEEALALSDRILAARPGFRLALHAQQINIGVLSAVAQNDLDPAAALRYALRSEEISMAILRLDLNSFVAANNLGVAHQTEGDALWAAGRLEESLPYYRKQLGDFEKATSGGSNQTLLFLYQMTTGEYPEARVGDFAAAKSLVAETVPYVERLHSTEPPGSILPGLGDALKQSAEADIDLEREDSTAARRLASEAVKLTQAVKPQKGFQEIQTYVTLYYAADIAGRADYLTGDYAAAESDERGAVEARKKYLTDSVNDRRDVAVKSTWLAMALAREGKLAEAARVIGPTVQFERELAAKNHGDQWVPVELAGALYAEALADKQQSAAFLREAARLLEGTAPTVRDTHDVKMWREWIRQAQQPRRS
jgi:hypothetical protein